MRHDHESAHRMTDRAPAAPCVLLAEEVWGSGLQAMRSLGRAGVPVHIVTAGAGADIYGRSRYCASAVDVDPENAETFCSEVARWMRRAGLAGSPGHVVPVIPLSDRLVEFLDASRTMFGDDVRLSIPSPPVTKVLLDKVESLRVAERAGLDVPRWVPVEHLDQLDTTDDLRLPIAIRPTSWATAGDEYFKISVARERAELRREVTQALERGARLIVQEYIEASDSDVELAITWNGPDGQVAVCTARKRRQSSPDGGVMVWGETVDLPVVRSAATRFLDSSGFTGLGGIELIRAAGRSWFIEFNPRLEAIHFLAARAGMDTVLMEYDQLTVGAPQSLPTTQRRAAAWIGTAWLTRLMNDPSDWRTAVSDRLSFARSPHQIRAVWSLEDPLPGLALLYRLITRGIQSLRRTRKVLA